MEELSFNKSSDYTENLELDAFNWMTGLIMGDDFSDRSKYQQNFLHKQYTKLTNKITAKYE